MRLCPFCGSSNLVRLTSITKKNHIECLSCGSRGPAKGNEEDAEVAWDKRKLDPKTK